MIRGIRIAAPMLALGLVFAATVSAQGLRLGKTPIDAKLIAKAITLRTGLGQVANPPTMPTGLAIQRRGFGVISDPRLEHDLNEVLKDIQKASPQAPVPAHVYVTADPAFRAYVAPDGAIFIAAGMLESVESRDELAGLLAHEYSHLLLKHTGKTATHEFARKAQALGSLYVEMRHGDAYQATGEVTNKALRDVLLQAATVESVQSGILPSRTRKHEQEADLLATDLLVIAGYNPVAMVDFLSRMEEWEARQAEVRTAQQKREATLKDVFQQHAQKGNVGEAVANVTGAAMTRTLASATNLFNRSKGKVRREHISPQQRIEAVRKRLDAVHADAERPDLRPVPWSGVRSVAGLFAGLETTHQFMEALQAGGEKRYNQLAKEVRASPAVTTPYARYALLHLYDSRNTKLAAVRAMQQELGRPDSLYAAHFLALQVLEQGSNPKEALIALEASRKSLGDPPELMPYSVRLYRKSGDGNAANVHLAKCMGVGNAALYEACQEAM